MADVQVSNGYVRIANRLYEALLYADITDTQRKIVLALIRLTYGWRRRTVVVSTAQLAAYCRCQPSGSFRRAFDELVARNVVIVLRRGDGPSASALTLQKDFTKWGRFGTSEECLSDIWDARPMSADDLLPDKSAIVEGDPREAPPTEGVPSERHPVCPSGDTLTGSKSLFGETVAGRKDIERHTTSSSSSSRETPIELVQLYARIGGGMIGRSALDTLMERVSPREVTWTHLLTAYLDGMTTKPVAPDRMLVAVLEYNIELAARPNDEPSARHFAGFVRDAVRRPDHTADDVLARRLLPPSRVGDEFDAIERELAKTRAAALTAQSGAA